MLGAASPVRAQVLTWQQALLSSANQPDKGQATATATAIDASGNVFITGTRYGEVTFGDTQLNGYGYGNVFLAKWNTATGTWAWAIAVQGYQASGLAVSNGNVYITGFIDGALTVAGTPLTTAGGTDVFLAKYVDRGTSVDNGWAVSAGGKGQDAGNDLAVSGNAIYVTGSYNTSTIIDNPVIAGTTLAALGGSDAFLAKYVDNGSSVSGGWAVRGGGPGADTGNRVAVGGSGVYVAGNFAGATGSFAGTTLTNAGAAAKADLFLAKYVDNGAAAGNGWAVRAGGSGADAANGLEASGTSVYLAGTLGAGQNFAVADQPVAGSATVGTPFLAKYSDGGAQAAGTWATTLTGADATAQGLALSGSALYVTGSFAGTLAAAGSSLTSTDRTRDVYVAKYLDAGGSVASGWAASGGGGASSGYSANYDGETGVAVAASGTIVAVGANTGELPAHFGPATQLAAPYNAALGQLDAATGTWQRVGSPLIGTTSYTTATAADANGNIFVAGYFAGNLAFGATQLTSQGDNDFFVAKWSPAANAWAWAVSGGGLGNDRALGVAVSNSNVYVTGTFAGSAYLAGTTLTSAGNGDMFVAKYVDNGSAASGGWAVRGGGLGADQGAAIAASGGGVYLTGTFAANGAQVAGTTLPSAGGTDYFVAKYQDNGAAPAAQWAVSGGGPGADQSLGLALSGSNVYVTGSFQGAAAQVAGKTLASAGADDIFVAKYADSGAVAVGVWALRDGGTGADVGQDLAVSGGNVYATGSFTSAAGASVAGTALAGAGGIDMFVAKYADNGAAPAGVWATSGGSSGSDYGTAVAVRNSAVYVAGAHDFMATIAGSSLTGNGILDLFLARFNDGGTAVTNGQALSGGGSSGASTGYALAVSGNDVYVGGYTTPVAAFGNARFIYPYQTNVNFLGRITEAAPTITSFTPTSGYEGVSVTINGTNLSSTSVITFGGTANNTVNRDFVVNSAGTQLTNVIVPIGVQTGPITVAAAGGTVTSAGVFTVTPTIPNPVPTITALTPASVGVGSPAFTLSITGTDFVPRCVVQLNGVALPTTLVSATQVTAAVPASALIKVGSYSLTVTNPTPAGGTSAAATFAVTAPALLSFSPGSGPVGTAITLTGSGLTRASVVTFAGTTNNTTSNFSVSSDGTQLTNVLLPNGAQTGPVSVTTPNGVATSTSSFTVAPPVITSFNPASGSVGTVLSIIGAGFAEVSKVTFTGTSNNVVTGGFSTNGYFSPGGTVISGVVVPAGAQTGPVSVTTPKGTGTSTAVFTVIVIPPPTVASFSPTSGPVGTRLTISGTDLARTSVVTFAGSTQNTVSSGFTVNSAGTVISGVVVPAGAQTGPVSVTTPTGTSSSPGSFTVTNTAAPTLSSFSPVAAPAGQTVTAKGANLSGVTGLTVNGVVLPAGAFTALTSSSFAFVVPAGAPATGTTTVTTAAGAGSSSAFRVVLRAISSVPAINGNQGALANSAVGATFSEPVVGTAGMVVYSAQTGGRKKGAVAATSSTVSFAAAAGQAATNFKPGETVYVTLPATTRTAAGVAATRQVYQFTTAAGGTGRGTFQAGSNPAGGAASWAIATGDVDGDGDLDLLTADLTGNTVSLLRNSGTGTYGAPTSIGVGQGPIAVALADVDGDGDLDLLASNHTANTVSVRLNNGAGTFSGTQDVALPANSAAEQLAVGDVDGDGDLDLLVGTGTNSTYAVTLRLNGGDNSGSNTGIFSGGQSISVSAESYGVALADVDGDGDLDVLAASATVGFVMVRLNGGDASGSNTGVFSGSGFVGVGDTPASIAAGDIDGDGDLDLVTANYGSDNVSICFNDGAGNFINYTANVNVPVGSGPYNVALADVDADGDLDILTANAGYGSTGNSASVLLNGGNASGSNTGVFSGLSAVAVGSFPRTLAVGDLDGDGDLDFATPSGSTGQVSVRLNGGTTPLAAAGASARPTFSVYPNPASRAATVTGLPAHQFLELLDAVGRTVLTATADAAGTVQLAWPAGVASGVYVLRAGTQARRLTIE